MGNDQGDDSTYSLVRHGVISNVKMKKYSHIAGMLSDALICLLITGVILKLLI